MKREARDGALMLVEGPDVSLVPEVEDSVILKIGPG